MDSEAILPQNKNLFVMNKMIFEVPPLDNILSRLESIESTLKQIHREEAMKPYILLTTKETAAALQITTRHLQNLRDRHDIDFVQEGRNVRFRPEHLQYYIEEHTVSSRSNFKIVV